MPEIFAYPATKVKVGYSFITLSTETAKRGDIRFKFVYSKIGVLAVSNNLVLHPLQLIVVSNT